MIRNWEIITPSHRGYHGAHEHGEHQSAATPLQASQCVAGHRGENHVAEDGDQADHQRVEHVVEYRDLLEHGNVILQRRGLRHQVGRHGVDVVALALERQGQFPDERADEQQEHQNQNQILDDFADSDLYACWYSSVLTSLLYDLLHDEHDADDDEHDDGDGARVTSAGLDTGAFALDKHRHRHIHGRRGLRSRWSTRRSR